MKSINNQHNIQMFILGKIWLLTQHKSSERLFFPKDFGVAESLQVYSREFSGKSRLMVPLGGVVIDPEQRKRVYPRAHY